MKTRTVTETQKCDRVSNMKVFETSSSILGCQRVKMINTHSECVCVQRVAVAAHWPACDYKACSF